MTFHEAPAARRVATWRGVEGDWRSAGAIGVYGEVFRDSVSSGRWQRALPVLDALEKPVAGIWRAPKVRIGDITDRNPEFEQKHHTKYCAD
jgi:hypothetical protein